MDREVPAFIAHDIPPEDADKWSLAGCHRADRVALCRALSPYRESLGDGYIAILASAWETDELDLVLPVLSEAPDRAHDILAYQEAGWPPARIVGLMRERLLYSNTSHLRLPPPELEAEEEMQEAVMPLSQFHELIPHNQDVDSVNNDDYAVSL
jgi:hypothetical protein